MRTDQLLAFSSLLLAEGASSDELAGRLEAASGVAEVVHDKITVWFRVEGAVPVFVYLDPTEGGLIEGAVPPIAADDFAPSPPRPTLQIGEPRFTGCPAMTDARADGQPGPVGKAGEPKKALILGPWKWQMDWDVEQLTRWLTLPGSDYPREGGGVTTIMTTSDRPSAFLDPSGSAVRLEDFCGWERYDTIILKTHGRTVCEEARCLTSLSAGRFAENEEVLRAYAGSATGVTFGTSQYGNLQGTLSPEQVADCIERLEQNLPGTQAADDCLDRLADAGHVSVTADFFRANYPGGLKDRLVFLSACQGMKEGNLARAIRGSGDSTGAILGFDQIIQTSVANKVLELFAEWVGTGRAIDDAALRELNVVADRAGATADVAGQIEGEFTTEEMADVIPDGSRVTRGSDIVSLHTERGGPELVDNGRVRVDGQPGDGDPDELLLGARLTGVGEEGPDAYEIEIRLDDRRLSLEAVTWTGGDVEGEFDAQVVASVGEDLVPDEPVDLEIRTVLPNTGGAISRWAYANLEIGGEASAVITVGGQTWQFELVGVYGMGACILGEDSVLTGGAVNGDRFGVTFGAELNASGGRLTVDDRDSGTQWDADANREGRTITYLIPAGQSQIDSITFDGSVISGTATFIDIGAFVEAWRTNGTYPSPVTGSFEIRCPSVAP